VSPPTEIIPIKRGVREWAEGHARSIGWSGRFGRGDTAALFLEATDGSGIKPDPEYRPDYEPYGDGQFYQLHFNIKLPKGNGWNHIGAMEKGSILHQWSSRIPAPVLPDEGTFSWMFIPYPEPMATALRVEAIRSGQAPGPALQNLWAEAVRDLRGLWSRQALAWSKDHAIRVAPEMRDEYRALKALTVRAHLDIETVVAARMIAIQGAGK
jgi:hypothetical protein